MDTLYHYCSNYVFQSIIENKSIWLSSLLQSNDSAEGKFVSNYILHTLKYRERLSSDIIYKLDGVLDDIDSNASAFGFCLSEEDDLLSQWRGYAEDGQGISIGFSKEYLEILTANEEEKYGLMLCKIDYYTIDSIEPINPFVSKIWTYIFNGAFSFIPKDSHGSPTNPDAKKKQNALFDLLRCLTEMSYHKFRIKSKAFSEEKEWRLLAEPQSKGISPAINEGLKSCKFRSTANKLIPYIEVKLKDFGANPIKEVIIGPKNETPIELIQLLLRNRGFMDVNVRHSKATYR
ncbi:MAG: DUF2971 domain-containing protein [Candidatus Thiodiazotropha taylori]|nr:DUF2971 domain-containing protein [Candidatus Thiodiazotropha taylori]